MIERAQNIYIKLYEGGIFYTKENLAKQHEVTIKTIENTLKAYSEDIIFDKKLKRYRFTSLLPKKIPYTILFNILKNMIYDKNLKEDFSTMDKLAKENDKLLLIETSKLSEILQKIIKFTVAISDNCILKIKYNGQSTIKYIRARSISNNEFSYFCFATYDLKNEENVGALRTFKFNKIDSIDSEEYVNDEIFRRYEQGNVFGEYSQENYVLLILDKISKDFFQSTDLFDSPQYKIVDTIGDSLKVKMYYNNLEIEVVNLVQKWMPHIKIDKNEKKKEEIENIITNNYKKLFNK